MDESDSSTSVQLAGTIMVIVIIVLFLIVVVILFLHLYAKWFWWRTEEPTPPPGLVSRRRRRAHRFVFASDEDVPVRNGLDLAVLRSMPIVVFQAEAYKGGLECAVCLCDVEEGEKARLLPRCNHGFHVECIDMWFQSHSTCPLCRSKVAPLLPSNEGDDSTNDPGRDGLDGENDLSLEEVLASGSSLEPASFPTNVLVWGDDTRVRTIGVNGGSTGFFLELEEGTSGHVNNGRHSFSASSSDSDGELVVDIPEQGNERLAEQESSKSLAPTRLRSFRRLLSWDKRAVAPTPSSSEEV